MHLILFSPTDKAEEHAVPLSSDKLPGLVARQSPGRHGLNRHLRNRVRCGQACVQPHHHQGSSPRRSPRAHLRRQRHSSDCRRGRVRPRLETGGAAVGVHRQLACLQFQSK